MANIKETQRITKLLNTLFDNEKFLKDLFNLCNNNYNSILFALGDILEYYITSRDRRVLTTEEMNIVVGIFKFIGNNKDYKVYNIKQDELPSHALKRNIIKNGYMTRSINNYFIKGIKRHGLGSVKNINDKFNTDIEYIESIFGKTTYSVTDRMENNQFCLTSPGVNSFYHAGSNCPKRFFIGVLGQKQDEMLPLKVGESKINYFKRVLNVKLLSTTLDKKNKKKVFKIALKYIKKLCKNRPNVLLIPTHSDNYSLKLTRERNNDYELMNFDDWIYFLIGSENALKFFSRDLGQANEEKGNMTAYKTIIPYKEIGVLSVPDRYEIMQLIAKNKGYKKNTEFSYLTGEIIEKNNQSS